MQSLFNNISSFITLQIFNEITYEFFLNRSLNLIMFSISKSFLKQVLTRIEVKNAIFFAQLNYKHYYNRAH